MSNLLQIGQRVTSSRGGQMVVVGIKGQQSPGSCDNLQGVIFTGGGADFELLSDSGKKSWIPESILRGSGGWKILWDSPLADELEIARLKKAHEQYLQKEADKKAAEDKQHQEDLERLAAEYPYLEQSKDSKKSSWALVAANIRTQLKKAYPGVKFSVTSEAYTGGSSVDVNWTDGPAKEEVNKLIDRYENGYFDGMDDSYHYVKSAWTELFGGVSYCTGYRKTTEEEKPVSEPAPEIAEIEPASEACQHKRLNATGNGFICRNCKAKV